MIQVKAASVSLAPGHYQLRTVLKSMGYSRKRIGKRTQPNPRMRVRMPTRHEAAYIEYPDGERELWNREPIS